MISKEWKSLGLSKNSWLLLMTTKLKEGFSSMEELLIYMHDKTFGIKEEKKNEIKKK